MEEPLSSIGRDRPMQPGGLSSTAEQRWTICGHEGMKSLEDPGVRVACIVDDGINSPHEGGLDLHGKMHGE